MGPTTTAKAEAATPEKVSLGEVVTGIRDVTARTMDAMQPVADGLSAALPFGLGKVFSASAEMTQQVANIGLSPLKSAYEIVSSGTPAEILTKMHPELQEAMADPAFASALNNALIKDDTMLPGLINMTKREGGSEVFKNFAESLKDPQNRNSVTVALNKVADDPNVKFGHLEEAFKSLTEYDPMKPEESRKRAHEAWTAVGATAEDADHFIEQGTEDFWKDILKHPERIGGMLGNMFATLGMPKEFCEYAAGFATKLVQGVQGLPGLAKGIVWDGNQELQDYTENYIKPGLESVKQTGADALSYKMS